MKLHFLKEHSLARLRSSVSGNFKHYKESTNQWIYDVLEETEPFGEYKFEVDDFELTIKDDTSMADIENSIKLYSAMKNLSDTQATDERLWAGLCHSDFWCFLNQRWQNQSHINEDNILSRYFFLHGAKRSLFQNSLSKLWWVGRLTYDESKKDPFELTRYFGKDFSTKSLIIFSNNYMANINITRGLISALQYIENEYKDIHFDRSLYYEATKYLNILGGMYILDCFSSDEIQEKIINYIVNSTELVCI